MSFSMHKSIPFLLIVLILLSIILSSWHALQGTLNFHTDIARDFLLFEDIYYNKNIVCQYINLRFSKLLFLTISRNKILYFLSVVKRSTAPPPPTSKPAAS